MSWLDVAALARQVWVAWLTLIFLGIAFYAFRPKNRKYFEECAEIPFLNDPDEPNAPGINSAVSPGVGLGTIPGADPK
jgi:cytochrome c oxidase cbb3-type subunit 4